MSIAASRLRLSWVAGRRTVMFFGPDRSRDFSSILTDAEIAAKLPGITPSPGSCSVRAAIFTFPIPAFAKSLIRVG